MDLGLRDKVVLITGGGAGIGAAITLACAAEGAVPVVVNDDGPAVQHLLATLQSQGARFGFIPLWLRTADDCRKAVDQAEAQFGQVDALVNNIGINDNVSLEHGSPEAFVASLTTNLLHVFYMAHFCLPLLRKRGGSIVNMASKVAYTGQGGTSGYAAAKGGILALTREWAVELLKYNIRVNAIIPAEVKTPAYDTWLATFPNPEAKLADIQARIPLGTRMTTPQEIASAVVWLLSQQSAHTTGQHLFIDGGYVHLDRAIQAGV